MGLKKIIPFLFVLFPLCVCAQKPGSFSEWRAGLDWRPFVPIDDQPLIEEIYRFSYLCYDRAHNKLAERKVPLSKKLKKDVQWIGSRFFLDTPGYYDEINMVERERGKAADYTCKRWWSEKDGLHERLQKAVKNPALLTRIGSWVEPALRLNTLSDFQLFFEQGIICKNKWAGKIIFRNFNHISARNNFLTIEKVGDHALNIRFRNQKLSIYGFDLAEIYINNDMAGSSFIGTVNASKEEVLAKLNSMGLTRSPSKDNTHTSYSSFFELDEKTGASHPLTLWVNDDCEFAKDKAQYGTIPNAACQANKPSTSISCIWMFNDD